MIRVLQIGMTNTMGGIETYLMNYYKNINREEIQFDFIDISDGNLCFKNQIISLGGKVYDVKSYYRHPLKYIKEIKRIITENNYQIIHCNMNSGVMIFPLIAAKISKAKIIIAHSHNTSSDKGIIKSILHNINKHAIPFLANMYFACSTEAGKWFFSKKILNSNKFIIIKNAIDIDEFLYNEEMRKIKRKELNINDETLVIGNVGKFFKQKNHRYLLKIYKKVEEENKDSVLLLIGKGPLKSKIQSEIEKDKLNNKVIFLEDRRDVAQLMQAMDVFVLPSLYEGLPLVGIEAQVAGLKCCFSNSITKELKISSNIKYLDLKKKADEWKDYILEKYERKSEIDTIRASGYDIEIEAKKLERLYMEMLKKK